MSQPIEVFVHDSLHSTNNVRFELEQAWSALDKGSHCGRRHRQAEPLRPDPRRFNQKGLFGIIVKSPTAQVAGSA
jgi:hypothetical protein